MPLIWNNPNQCRRGEIPYGAKLEKDPERNIRKKSILGESLIPYGLNPGVFVFLVSFHFI